MGLDVSTNSVESNNDPEEKALLEKADRLEKFIPTLQDYIEVLRGHRQDVTGRGLEAIIRSHLEAALGVRIVSKDRWKEVCGSE